MPRPSNLRIGDALANAAYSQVSRISYDNIVRFFSTGNYAYALDRGSLGIDGILK